MDTEPVNRIESALAEFLTRKLPPDSTPTRLRESITYSLLGPGKRIRPRLALSVGEILGLPLETSLACALAVELTHCFTLIHDDLPCLDNDDFRRGRPSNHRQFDEATALLAGDALQTLAFEALLDAASSQYPERVLKGCKLLSGFVGPRGVIAGQVAESTLGNQSTFEDLLQMHRQKTGALFDASVLIPCSLSGISEQDPRHQALADFSHALGSAFQILDDLDDAQQDSNRTPVNTIYYKTVGQAAEFASQKLSDADQRLENQFGEKSKPLLLFSEDLLKKLAPYMDQK